MGKEHWGNIYSTKGVKEVSWFQAKPQTSLDLISSLKLNKQASIIDIGGGDGFLVDELLKLSYTNITVLDIQKNAINRAKERLGEEGNKVKWIVSDITDFIPSEKYDVWHDRAVFHFLTEENDIKYYKNLVAENISKNAYFILATFADNGPDKCSGLCVSKYSEIEMKENFSDCFEVLDSFRYQYSTPFASAQNFIFSLFKKSI